MKHLYRAAFAALCFTSFIYSPSQALACACPSGVNCFEYCGGKTTTTTQTESTNRSVPSKYTGKSVLQYRNALKDRVNIGGTMNRLGSRIERAASGEMAPISGMGKPRVNIGVKLPTFGQVVGGITQNDNDDNPSTSQDNDSVGLGDLGTAVKNGPKTQPEKATAPAASPSTAEKATNTPSNPQPTSPPTPGVTSLSPEMMGVVATIAKEGSAMSDNQLNSFLESRLQDENLSQQDKQYIETLQAEYETTGTFSGAVNQAKIDFAAIEKKLASANLATAASADILRKATDLMTRNRLQDASRVSALEYTVVSAQATAGDAVASTVNQQWSANLGTEVDRIASANRTALIESIANEADVSREAATQQYNAIVGWVQDRAKEGRSYDEIMNSLKTNSPYLTLAQRTR